LAQPIRVALDATPLSIPSGGVRRYTFELARALAAGFPADAYYLVSDQPFEPPPGLATGEGPTGLRKRWWSVGLPREWKRLSIDVFHGTDFAVPYLPTRPAVMTVHDCTPWRRESWGETTARVRRRTPILLKLGLATMIVTPTQAVRREVIERFGVRPERIVAIPLAAAPHFHPIAAAGPPARPYFVYLGALNTRKNVGVVEQAWKELRKECDVDLRIPAREGHVPEDELPAIYSGAAAVLYPSLYEGFGLPVLEAMQCGALVIASKDPAILEVTAGAAIHVDAGDVRGWIDGMRSALRPDGHSALRARALERTAAFSWERTAILTREVYNEARRLF
jgi:glycosyltransferase involved in cell wall biosynthesis